MTWIIPTYSNKMAESQDVLNQETFLLVGKLEPCLVQWNILKMRDVGGRAGRGSITVHANGCRKNCRAG